MQKSILSTIAVLVLGLPLQAQQTIRCSSQDGQKKFCPANTKNGVRLVREQSDNVCQQGSTWSYNRSGIQVNGGCSAEFEVSGTGGADTNGGYGNNGNYNNGGGNDNNGSSNGSNHDSGGGDNRNGDNGTAHGSYDDRSGGNNRTGNGDHRGNGYGDRQHGVVLPSGTQLTVRLEQAVRPAEVNQGDVIPASLVNDLSVNGSVVATAGTPVQAKVQSAQGSPLDLRLDSMTVNGRTYALATNSVHSLQDSASAQASNDQSARSQLGGILGNIAGGNQLPSGTVFQFRLVSPARPRGGNNESNPNVNRDNNRNQ